jgi:lipopolysaccharide transport system permease protein
MFKSLWDYRHFIFSSIKNDLLVRFLRSKFGALWVILNPLSQVLIFALILSSVMRARIEGMDCNFSFSIYLLAGMLAWNLFFEIVVRSTTLILDNANVLKKINFPKITMPVIMLGSCVVNNLFLFLSIVVIFFLMGHGFNFSLLALIPLAITTIIFAFGVGLIVGILNVFIRDIGQVIPIGLQIMFWLTPIVYPANIIPVEHAGYLYFNPMAPIVEGYHSVLLYGKVPDFTEISIVFIIGCLLTSLGLYMFRKASPEMVDVL